MSKWQPIGLLLCLVLAWVANRSLRPTIPYEMPDGQRTSPTGSLTIETAGQRHDLKLVTVSLVQGALRPLFAKPKAVGVLWLRSVEEGGGEPDLEIFADLTVDGAAVDVSAQDLAFLRQRDLPVLGTAPGDAARSRVRLPGDAEPRAVRSGVLRVERTLSVSAEGEPARTRIEGSVRLALDGAGGDLAGTFNARFAR